MAQKINVTLIDDLTGEPAHQTVSFSLDGASYEIDLTDKNAQALRETFAKYVGVARRASGGSGRRGRRSGGGADRQKVQEVRAWAKKKGLKVSDRGRISAEIMKQYDDASR